MYHTGVYEIIVQKKNYDVLSADAQFYAYSEKFLYRAFDKHIREEDRAIFYQKVREADESCFLVRLADETEEGSYVVMQIKKGKVEGTIVVYCIVVADIYNIIDTLQHKIIEQRELLSLHGDICFEYNPADKMVRTYEPQLGMEKAIAYSIDKWRELLFAGASPAEHEEVEAFITNMKKGIRRFSLSIKNSLATESEANAFSTFEAMALYEGATYRKLIGYLNKTDSRSSQDIKKENLDALTGVLAREEIIKKAIDIIDTRKCQDTTIAIVDVDHFKQINDTYGHRHGDAVLQEVAGIIMQQLGETGVAGRIGGDEFLIIFYDAGDMENMRGRLRSIKNKVITAFPTKPDGMPMITLSIGCASYPKDALNYEDVFTLADFSLYRAKEKGRNRYIIFDSEKHGTLEKVKASNMTEASVNTRGDMSYGDILCDMAEKVYTGGYSLGKLLEEFARNFEIERIVLYGGRNYRFMRMAGTMLLPDKVINETQDYLLMGTIQSCYDEKGILLINNTQYFEEKDATVYEMLKKQGVKSFYQIKYNDKKGEPCILSIESVTQKRLWNPAHFRYYKILARLLKEYIIVP